MRPLSTCKRRAALFSFASLCSPLIAIAQQTPQTPAPENAIRVEVNVVSVGLTVTNANGRFVNGLKAGDFKVFDNGKEQLLTGFYSSDEPGQIVLMMECGPAAIFMKNSELLAADRLLQTLSPKDRIAIITYSRDPNLMLEFTTDKANASATLHGMNFMAGFSDLNLAASLAKTLDWLSSVPGKKSIVLLSSGVDTSSEADWGILHQRISASDVRIFAASIAGDIRTSEKRKRLSASEREDRAFLKASFADADKALRAIASATGGRAYFPKNQKDSEKMFSELAEYATHEYSVSFSPALPDGLVHSLQVKVGNPFERVAHRQAYLAPLPSRSTPD